MGCFTDNKKQKNKIILLKLEVKKKWLWHLNGLNQKPETDWDPERKEHQGPMGAVRSSSQESHVNAVIEPEPSGASKSRWL